MLKDFLKTFSAVLIAILFATLFASLSIFICSTLNKFLIVGLGLSFGKSVLITIMLFSIGIVAVVSFIDAYLRRKGNKRNK